MKEYGWYLSTSEKYEVSILGSVLLAVQCPLDFDFFMNLTSDFLLPNLQMTGDEEIYERCQEKKTLSTVIKHAELLLVYKVRKLQVARN